MNTHRQWDIFCNVIDNHGDLGVCWRLARQLVDARQQVRLWVDDLSALPWMASVDPVTLTADRFDLEIRHWDLASDTALLASLPPAQVWVEAFGCTLPPAFVAHAVATRANSALCAPVWLNLEYLSAEAWVPTLHGLPSPVMSGSAKGWTKHFFYPGFTPDTGGLLRETALVERQRAFEAGHQKALWRAKHAPTLPENGLLISLFCYEPEGLPQFLRQLADSPHQLLITPDRPLRAVQEALSANGANPNAPTPQAHRPAWQALNYTHQDGFDEMLWACDLNFVRGEDSLVRALWAGHPFVWHIYPQSDGAHHGKLDAFLSWLQAPPSLRHFHHIWNGFQTGDLPTLDHATLSTWAHCVTTARARLLDQPSLTPKLLQFVANHSHR